jgi:hypothetical protein
MTIGTSNVSFSSIATEIGKSQTNLSLRDAAQDTMILNPGNSRQTFTLTDSLTLNTQDSSVADNMNLAGSNNFEASEFKSYDKVPQIIFSSSTNSSSTTADDETIVNLTGDNSGGCQVLVRMGGEIYCKRVGNDLVWYVGEGNFDTGSHKKESTGIGSDTECARLAGVGSSTNVSVAYSVLQQQSGFFDASLGAFSSGSTNSSLASTNTKIGFDFRVTGLGECVTSYHSFIVRTQIDFTVTVPNYDARIFRFFGGFRGRYRTTNANCC